MCGERMQMRPHFSVTRPGGGGWDDECDKGGGGQEKEVTHPKKSPLFDHSVSPYVRYFLLYFSSDFVTFW